MMSNNKSVNESFINPRLGMTVWTNMGKKFGTAARNVSTQYSCSVGVPQSVYHLGVKLALIIIDARNRPERSLAGVSKEGSLDYPDIVTGNVENRYGRGGPFWTKNTFGKAVLYEFPLQFCHFILQKHSRR